MALKLLKKNFLKEKELLTRIFQKEEAELKIEILEKKKGPVIKLRKDKLKNQKQLMEENARKLEEIWDELNEKGFMKEREFLAAEKEDWKSFRINKESAAELQLIREKIVKRGRLSKYKNFLKEWELLKCKGYLKYFSLVEKKELESVVVILKKLEKERETNEYRIWDINADLRQRKPVIDEMEEIEKQIAYLTEQTDTVLIGSIELTFRNRPHRVIFPVTGDSKDFHLFLNNQKTEPQLITGEIGTSGIEEAFEQSNYYIYRNDLYWFAGSDIYTPDQIKLLIKEHYFKQQKKFNKLIKEIRLFEKLESSEAQQSREPIPEEVRFAVWRRDGGKCVKCGSQKSLEFDHIIPVSKGGSNTERNIQLLCEKCNREKSNKI